MKYARSKFKIIPHVAPAFTLIELLIVFSLMGILSTASIVSFVTYNQTQTVANASRDIRQMLTNAKSRAQSQVKPSACEGSLHGYQVRFCSETTDCPLSGGQYEMSALCTGNSDPLLVSPQKNSPPKSLPKNVHFSESMITPKIIVFKVLNGGVEGSGEVIIEGYEQNRIIKIDTSGNVYEE